MKKILKFIAVVLFVAFVAIQFYRPDRANPPIIQAETLEASAAIPEEVAPILTRSCNDCHSNKTVYPWYSNVSRGERQKFFDFAQAFVDERIGKEI